MSDYGSDASDAENNEGQPINTKAKINKEAIQIDMNIKFPKKKKKDAAGGGLVIGANGKKKNKKPLLSRTEGSMFSLTFTQTRAPEAVYFEHIDCVAIPNFMTPDECTRLIELSEKHGFTTQMKQHCWNMHWLDLIDPHLARTLFTQLGLQNALKNTMLKTQQEDKFNVYKAAAELGASSHGLPNVPGPTANRQGDEPIGLNDVIRIQKYPTNGVFGKHIDRPVVRNDGQSSKLSLRVFLNEHDFDGGHSVFHVPFQTDPVVIQPQQGLALIYFQGPLCHVQEERTVTFGTKYVLRADVMYAGAANAR